MSKRDRAWVREIGLSVAQVAAALGRSRQAVNRGMAQTKDYLRPADLVSALGHWRAGNPGVYRLAVQKVRELYPELAKVVAHAGVPEVLPFSSDVPGQYWLITGDYVAFRSNLAQCASQLDAVCEQKHSGVVFVVGRSDESAARRLEAKFPKRVNVRVANEGLRLLPSVLLRVAEDGELALFAASDGGFVGLSRSEAARIRLALEDLLSEASRR